MLLVWPGTYQKFSKSQWTESNLATTRKVVFLMVCISGRASQRQLQPIGSKCYSSILTACISSQSSAPIIIFYCKQKGSVQICGVTSSSNAKIRTRDSSTQIPNNLRLRTPWSEFLNASTSDLHDQKTLLPVATRFWMTRNNLAAVILWLRSIQDPSMGARMITEMLVENPLMATNRKLSKKVFVILFGRNYLETIQQPTL